MLANTYLSDHDGATWETFQSIPVQTLIRHVDLPELFDPRSQWGEYLTPVMDQGTCGSCAPFASSACLADRCNIMSKGQLFVDLSPMYMLLCNLGGLELDIDPTVDSLASRQLIEKNIEKQLVCHGNSLSDVWRFLTVIGTASRQCAPYNDKEMRHCSDLYGQFGATCVDGIPLKHFRSIYYYRLPDQAAMMQDIYLFGSISSAMMLHEDFYTFDFKTKVYEWDGQSAPVVGHAVRIIGWGPDYWLVANSWGRNWGDDGYFKLRRGVNECGIEMNAIGAYPDMFQNPSSSLVMYELPETAVLPDRLAVDDKDGPGGGIDSLTGYMRFQYAAWPDLQFQTPQPVIHVNMQTFSAGEQVFFSDIVTPPPKQITLNIVGDEMNFLRVFIVTMAFAVTLTLLCSIVFHLHY